MIIKALLPLILFPKFDLAAFPSLSPSQRFKLSGLYCKLQEEIPLFI
jgi:hypothetical protein